MRISYGTTKSPRYPACPDCGKKMKILFSKHCVCAEIDCPSFVIYWKAGSLGGSPDWLCARLSYYKADIRKDRKAWIKRQRRRGTKVKRIKFWDNWLGIGRTSA